jgi:hypothetical protein
MAPRKTAAQKAAEAAEREEYTGIPEGHTVEDVEEAPMEPAKADTALSAVRDEKSGKLLTIQQLKNKLRNEAEREVLDAHRPEVVERTAAKYKTHNLDYVRRLTEQEKAAKQIEELYEKFPQLRPQLEQQQAQREVAFAPSDYNLGITSDERPDEEQGPFTDEYEPVTIDTVETGPEFDTVDSDSYRDR